MVKKSPNYKAITRLIKSRMIFSDLTAEEMCKLTGVCLATVYNRINKPEEMKIKDLCRLATILKVEPEEFLKELKI